MNRYTLLFLALRSFLPSKYHITFGTVTEDLKRFPNCIGIAFKGGTPSNRALGSGKYNMRSTHALLNVVLSPNNSDINQGYADVTDLLNSLECLSQHTYIDDDTGSSVTILFTETLGDVNQLGFNSNGQACFSINILINYIGG